ELARELERIHDRPRREPPQRSVRKRRIAEREEHLAGRRRMPDARPPDAGDALHRRRAQDEVDRERVVLSREGYRDRLAGFPGQRDEVWPRDLAQIEAREHGV